MSGRKFGRVVSEGSNCRVPLASDEVGIPAYGGQAQRSRHRFVGLSAGGGFKSHPRHQMRYECKRIANTRLAEHERGHLSSSLFLHDGDDVGVGIERVGDGRVPGCYSSLFRSR